MLGWFKRNDGFEWKKHIRTTVRLRRADRRRKAVAAKDVVARGLKDAGAASVAASGTVAHGFWSGAKATARATWRGLVVAGRGAGTSFRAGLSAGLAMGQAGVVAAHPVGVWLWRGIGLRPVRIASALIAGVAATWALSRYRVEGLDTEVSVAGWIAGAAALVAVLPVAIPVIGGIAAPKLAGLWSAIVTAAYRLPPVARGGLAFAAIGAGVVATSSLMPVWRMPSLPSMPTLAILGAPEIAGRAQVLSGDTLRLNGQVIALAGVEAPERGQRCLRAGGRSWRCGIAAADALAQKVRRETITCAGSSVDERGRKIARCRIGDEDLAEALVRGGHVFAQTGLFTKYGTVEAEAKSRKVGLWAGEVERPAAWKTRLLEEARKRAPNNCPVKGVRLASGLHYVMPWDDGYSRTQVRTSRGERWFCSEDDARAAGYQPAA